MASKRSGPPVELGDVISRTLSYDHWTSVSLKIVQAAVVLVVIINLVCLIADPEGIIGALGLPALGLAGLSAIGTLLMLFMVLIESQTYTLWMAAVPAFLLLLAGGWFLLLTWSAQCARELVVAVSNVHRAT